MLFRGLFGQKVLKSKRKVYFIKLPLLFSQGAQNKRQEQIFIFSLFFFRGPPPKLNAKKFHFFSHFPFKYIYTNGNQIQHHLFLLFNGFQHTLMGMLTIVLFWTLVVTQVNYILCPRGGNPRLKMQLVNIIQSTQQVQSTNQKV